MPKHYEPHKIYRAMLRLYPKAHQKEYSQQMAQTVDDILSDCRSTQQRMGVWLRVGCELPANIIEEHINNLEGMNMNNLLKRSGGQLTIIVSVLIVAVAGIIFGLVLRHQLGEIRSLNSQLSKLQENVAASQGPTYYDVTVSPSEQTVYLPLAHLKLTDSALNEQLVYQYTDPYTVSGIKKVFPANLNISTHELAAAAASTTQQFDCTQVAYADFLTPSYPVNPKYKSDGSVKLADGRTMNVYYAPQIPGCELTWQFDKINPKAIADSLKAAASY